MVRFLERLLTIAAFAALVACGAAQPSLIPTPSPIAARLGSSSSPSVTIPGACADGFVVGDRFYGLTCSGVDPPAVAGQTLAIGNSTYAEVRELTAIPPSLWLAVRGDVPCLPADNEPLQYEWYLAQSDPTQAELDEWGEAAPSPPAVRSPQPGILRRCKRASSLAYGYRSRLRCRWSGTLLGVVRDPPESHPQTRVGNWAAFAVEPEGERVEGTSTAAESALTNLSYQLAKLGRDPDG